MLDEVMIRSLHVQALRQQDLHATRPEHVLFGASTISALLDGAYEGDVSFSELARHGDLGLGTLNGLDGEMIALDGDFWRADADGNVSRVPPSARTPFAVVVPFRPAVDFRIEKGTDFDGLREEIDRRLPPGSVACAIRVDGRFELIRARSVPRQRPPFPPLAEVVAEQRVFELHELGAILVGFRFPAWAESLEVPGYHLHAISDDRSRGGHVLELRLREARVRLDYSAELRVELPPGIELDSGELSAAAHEALRAAEHNG